MKDKELKKQAKKLIKAIKLKKKFKKAYVECDDFLARLLVEYNNQKDIVDFLKTNLKDELK